MKLRQVAAMMLSSRFEISLQPDRPMLDQEPMLLRVLWQVLLRVCDDDRLCVRHLP
jgi:hypothetical protein